MIRGALNMLYGLFLLFVALTLVLAGVVLLFS